MIYRQGDVLIMGVDDGRDDLRERSPEPRDEGRIVLAYGEVTGHAHAIADTHATLWRLAGDDRLLTVTGAEVALRHEEHDTIVIPPGTYLVRRQREYVPAADESAPRSSYVAD
jgi:hypothetical protein